jgi:hypothetical protein
LQQAKSRHQSHRSKMHRVGASHWHGGAGAGKRSATPKPEALTCACSCAYRQRCSYTRLFRTKKMRHKPHPQTRTGGFLDTVQCSDLGWVWIPIHAHRYTAAGRYPPHDVLTRPIAALVLYAALIPCV